MRRPCPLLPLFLLLSGAASLPASTSLSLPGIPDFRLPSAGSVDTVFPAATGGRRPYSYSISGLPSGISFSSSTRRARGTLPTVSVDTTYRVTYSVWDSLGATDSSTFTAVVRPPVRRPSSSPPLSLPGVSDFRLPSAGSVDTVFPAAAGGRRPYSYSISGLPSGISFSSSTRRARGTLPTVSVDTTYRVTYSVRDAAGATDSSVFTTVVTAPAVRRSSPPGPPLRRADPPTVPVEATRLYSVPFAATETGAGETSYRFRLGSRTSVSVNLTGMDRDIDCQVGSSACTNRSGTQDDSWNGTLAAGTHTLKVWPYDAAASGSWTVRVGGTAVAPPPPPPPASGGSGGKRGVSVSAARTYVLRLSEQLDVSVELTGMTIDFDCTVAGNRCTNRGGTQDDSWDGTLGRGDHKIVVYPYQSGTGNYTLKATTKRPASSSSSGTVTTTTTLVDVDETAVSTEQTYRLALPAAAEVTVALDDMTIDFDCRMGSSDCTNRGSTSADSWNGSLQAGNHTLTVFPYDEGAGNYSLTVTATTTVTVIATPMGGPTTVAVFCEADDQGNIKSGSCETATFKDTINVTPPDPGPPPGAGPGQGPAPPPDPNAGGPTTIPGGGGGSSPDNDEDETEEPEDELEDACYTSLVESDRVTAVPLQTDRALGSKWGGRNTARKWHRGIDVRAARGDKVFTRVSGDVHRIDPRRYGTNSYNADSGTFGNRYPANGTFVSLVDDLGREHVWVHLQEVSNTNWKSGDRIQAGTVIGKANNSGNSRGDHLHYTIWATVARQKPLDPEALMSSCNE